MGILHHKIQFEKLLLLCYDDYKLQPKTQNINVLINEMLSNNEIKS